MAAPSRVKPASHVYLMVPPRRRADPLVRGGGRGQRRGVGRWVGGVGEGLVRLVTGVVVSIRVVGVVTERVEILTLNSFVQYDIICALH